MYKIEKIKIVRFRSIMDMVIKVNIENNIITFCGANNAGKTNILRAIELFYKPDKFLPSVDAPNHKYYGSYGGSVFPQIELTFKNEKTIVSISRAFNSEGNYKTTGYKKVGNLKKAVLNEKEIENFIDTYKFYFVESANISLPILINDLTEELFDTEYGNSEFRGAKGELKIAFESYVNKLSEILSDLASEITPMFSEFQKTWSVNFELNSNVNRFRDLISDDIDFVVNDGSNKRIDSKGAGLQRLAYILLNIRIINKITKKPILFLIDEPDIYLHPGLQKKLLSYLRLMNSNVQIFITTHSKVFIDTYTLENVFLLDLEITPDVYFDRKKAYFNIFKSKLVNMDNNDGTKKIREYLGIEQELYELLQGYNIIVEGESDKKYIVELIKYFKFNEPNIIPINGATNLLKYLDFYDSYYSNTSIQTKPVVQVLLDNDNAGREAYKKAKGNLQKYKNILVKINFTPNFVGDVPDNCNLSKIYTNNEIEDLIYPKLFCYLVNNLLSRKRMKKIDQKKVCSQIVQKAFKDKGIISLCEFLKNDSNPENGHELCFAMSDKASENIKTSLSNMFNIEADYNIIKILNEEDIKYPQVKNFIQDICNNNL
ncbi:ATP-dependent nuclease [Clostridium saccharoperbutylacetonicum]|uniref:ATP-dependent nuclease n=1 Tax=Clostridium saccharoperbutylacetonicum TaxID=36745 RepID=UPI0039E857DD